MLSRKQFGEVYDEHVDKIYRFVFVKVSSESTAQDLTSETFARTLEYITKNKGDIDNIQAFLYRTARNLVFDYYRQKSRSDVPLKYESQDIVEKRSENKDMPDFAAEQSEQVFEMKKALQDMEGEYGDILAFHYIEDLSIKEIADILSRPEGTIRVMLHRGIKELKKLLDV